MSLTVTPYMPSAIERPKTVEEASEAFASVFFRPLTAALLESSEKEEGSTEVWKDFQAEIFAQHLAKSPAAEPIKQAIQDNLISLQQVGGQK